MQLTLGAPFIKRKHTQRKTLVGQFASVSCLKEGSGDEECWKGDMIHLLLPLHQIA